MRDDARKLWTARAPSPHVGKPYGRKDLKIVKKWFVETKATNQRGLPPVPRESETRGRSYGAGSRWEGPARLKPRTSDSYRQLIENHLMPGLGSHPLRQLSPEQVQSLLNERAVGRQPRTVVHIHACLRVAQRDAKRWHLVARNVATRDYVELAPAPEAEIQPFTPAQATASLLPLRASGGSFACAAPPPTYHCGPRTSPACISQTKPWPSRTEFARHAQDFLSYPRASLLS